MARRDGTANVLLRTVRVEVNLGNIKDLGIGTDATLTAARLRLEGFDSASRVHQTGHREFAVYASGRCQSVVLI